VGQERRPVEWIAELLRGKDRSAAAPTAPPDGLYLVDVRYPDQILPGGRPPALLRALGGLDRF
jgi:tRNA pseudouridine38-40 synthase